MQKEQDERRKKREEKRRRKKREKREQEEAQRLARRIALEERKLLLAQRKLESIRLISELIDRVKVCRKVDSPKFFIAFKSQILRTFPFLKAWTGSVCCAHYLLAFSELATCDNSGCFLVLKKLKLVHTWSMFLKIMDLG